MIRIPHRSKIGIADPCALQKWNVLWLRMSDLFCIGYYGNTCYLQLLNCFIHAIELTTSYAPPLPGPSCWGSYCKCITCPHDIWWSKCTPINSEGHWPYLLPLLWPIRPNSCERPHSPSWYYLKYSG